MIDLNNAMSDADVLIVAESIYDGWYAESGRVEWDDFLDRLEIYADIDLGSDMMSPGIKLIKRHIANYRKLG
jgi:hypothetical protein